MRKTDLSQEDARRYFDYADGELIWRPRPRSDFKTVGAWKDWNNKFPGLPAGSRSPRGYTFLRVAGRSLLRHRVIWSWYFGPTADEVDHRDHDTTNDRIENLRAATGSQNKANRRKLKAATSHYNGVSYEADRRRWKAGVRKDQGKTVTIGRFKCPTLAAFAYDKAAAAEFGEFAMLNFPKQGERRAG